MSKTNNRKPIEIKISTVVAISAIVRESDPALLDAAMLEITCGAPDYFDNEFAIIDIGSLDKEKGDIDWDGLIKIFKSYRLNPIAVRNATPEMGADILAHGLSLDTAEKPRMAESTEQEQYIAEPQPATTIAPPAAIPMQGPLVIDTPVRAGQRIYARGCDLIVTAVVNNGAELIADGSIHVYAPLRGRALAGANGNDQARIFALSMEAELLSIAGIYRTFENGLPKELSRCPTQVRLIEDRIDLLAIK